MTLFYRHLRSVLEALLIRHLFCDIVDFTQNVKNNTAKERNQLLLLKDRGKCIKVHLTLRWEAHTDQHRVHLSLCSSQTSAPRLQQQRISSKKEHISWAFLQKETVIDKTESSQTTRAGDRTIEILSFVEKSFNRKYLKLEPICTEKLCKIRQRLTEHVKRKLNKEI